MSLKSSEIHNCSRGITTVQESFLISSSSQACFPLAIRPMRRRQQLFLKIFLNSPELICSILFSLHMLWMTKKIHYFLRHFIIGKRIFPWFSISANPLHHRICSWRRTSRFSSSWFCFGLWSACKILRIQFQRKYTSSWTFGISVSVLFKFITNNLIHKEFWPKSEFCLCSKTTLWSQLYSYHESNWLQLLMRAQFCVPLDPSFWLWCFFFSWKSVFTTSHWGLTLPRCSLPTEKALEPKLQQMLLPANMRVLCMRRCFKIDRNKILMVLVHVIHKQKEYCLSSARTLTSRN